MFRSSTDVAVSTAGSAANLRGEPLRHLRSPLTVLKHLYCARVAGKTQILALRSEQTRPLVVFKRGDAEGSSSNENRLNFRFV